MLEDKRVLFFDDAWERRCQKFLKYVPHAVIVRTIRQANREVLDGRWDLVFLDYDLEESETPKTRKGIEVANHMVQNHEAINIRRVVIHSTSEKGRDQFRLTLRPLYITRSMRFEQELMPLFDKANFLLGA